jgi:ribosomal RNA assembly protein
MQEIYVENIRKVLENKNKLEKALGVKITNIGKNLFVDGPAEKEFVALEVIESIELGFSVHKALLLTEEENILQIINIKDVTKKKNLKEIKARIIGTNGKTLKVLNELTDCQISVSDSKVGLIGDAEYIEEGVNAVKSLILGSKQGNVYTRLEREKKKKRLGISGFKRIKGED